MAVLLESIVTLNPTETAGWQDIDVSANVPAGATGVVIEVHFPAAATDVGTFGARKNGVTTSETPSAYDDRILFMHVGVDSDRIFEVNVNDSNVLIYLHGYHTSEAVFLDTWVDVSPGSQNTWTNIDISSSTGGDTSTAAILYMKSSASNATMGARKEGSTDTWMIGALTDPNAYTICAVDGSEILEGYVGSTSQDKIYLVGYFTSGITMPTNATSDSPTTGSYQNLTVLGDTSAAMGLYHFVGGTTNTYIRNDGGTEDRKELMGRQNAHACVGVTSGIAEAYLTSAGTVYTTGYLDVTEASEPAAPASGTNIKQTNCSKSLWKP